MISHAPNADRDLNSRAQKMSTRQQFEQCQAMLRSDGCSNVIVVSCTPNKYLTRSIPYKKYHRTNVEKKNILSGQKNLNDFKK